MQLTRGAVARVAILVLPWTWFWVRDRSASMELVAVLLPAIIALGIALCLALGDRRGFLRLAALSWTVFGVVAVVGPWTPRSLGHPRDDANIVIAVAPAGGDGHADDVAAAITAQHPDVVVVPDAGPRLHATLAHAFRYSLRGDAPESAALGVYSNVPVEAPKAVPSVLDDHHVLRVVVGEKLVLWALHQPYDWRKPGTTSRTARALLDEVEKETLPVVIAGDTTIVDRGRSYRKIASRFTDAMRASWVGPTVRVVVARPLLLRVDHIFEPNDWCADRAGRFAISGSDRRGVRVRIGPCA